MKHTPKLRFLFFILLFSAMALQGKPCTSPVRVVCPTIDCGVNIVHISQADVGPAGYVISTPGRYCLIEDITWAPTASGTPSAPVAAISILSSNVELNLNGYVLSGPSNFTNNIGIKVGSENATISNVVILGGSAGSVQNFSLGIFADPVNNLLIQDLSALNNGAAGSITNNGLTFVGGIAVVGTNGGPGSSQNVVLRRVNTSFNGGVGGAIATYGTLLTFVNSALVENSQFNQNTSPNNATYGLFLSRTNDVDVRDSQGNDNVGAIAVAGFRIDESGGGDGRNQLLRNTANANILAGTPPASLPVGQNVYFADGFYLKLCDHVTLIDCVAIENTASLGGIMVPQAAAGFELERSFDCRLERCMAGDNSSAGIARGFHIAANRATCQDCYSETNIGNTASYGYDLENFANFGTPSTTSGIPNVSAIIASKAYGFARSDNTVGIRLHNATNCVIDGNLLQQNAPVGILLDQTADCLNQQNVIKHNQIVNLAQIVLDEIGAPSFRGIWAIEDNTGSPNSAGSAPNNTYYDNYAFDYPGNANFTNYNTGVRQAGNNIVNPANTFISQWTVPGDPPGPTGVTKLTNLDIIYRGCSTGIIPG